MPCKPTLKVLKVKKFQPKVSFFSFPQFRAPVFFPKPPSPVPVPEIKKKKYISVRIPAALRKFSTIASHRLRPSSFLIGKKRRKFSKRSFLLRFKFRPRPFSLKALTRRRATFPIFGLFQGRKIKNRRRSFFFRISPLYSSRSSFIFANFLRQFPFSGFCFLSYLRRFYIRSRRRIPSRFFLTSAIPIRRRRELNSVFA